MTPYDLAMQQFRIAYLVRAVIAAGGNECAAARTIGVHRNTISRAIIAGGYTRRRIKKLVEHHREASASKPVQSASAEAAVQRLA